jgi:hypothetical protein
LTIESSEDELLEVLGSPKHIVVDLVRYMRHHSDAQTSEMRGVGTDGESKETIGTAIWWPRPEEIHDDLARGAKPMMWIDGQFGRVLQGEIRLARDLKPSFSFAHLNLQVCIYRSLTRIPDMILFQ